MPLRYGNQQHWEGRSAEARAMAEGMADAAAKQIMLAIADGYYRLAKLAEAQEARVPMTKRKSESA